MRKLKVNDVVEYSKTKCVIINIDKGIADVLMLPNKNPNTLWHLDSKEIKFISTYRDHLKNEIIKELNKSTISKWVYEDKSFIVYDKNDNVDEEIGLVDGYYYQAFHILPKLAKIIIEFFELEQ